MHVRGRRPACKLLVAGTLYLNLFYISDTDATFLDFP